MDIEEGRKQWQALYDKWEPINHAARQASTECLIGFKSGNGPSVEALDQAEVLDRQAMELRTQMDEVSRQVFGS